MKKKIFTFFSSLLLLFFSQTGLASDCSLRITDLKKASKFNYVIVPGILNEFMSFYMTEHRRYLMSIGVPNDQIYRLNNRSYIRPDDNVNAFNELMDEIDNEKKVVFIAHSKGALETLYYLLNLVDLSRIERAFLIQGALDGSSSYKMVMDGKSSLWPFKYIRYLQYFTLVKRFSESFDALKVREKLKGLSFKKDILDRVTFIESEKKLEDLPARFLLLGSFYQQVFKSAGDGVLLKTDHVPYELQKNTKLCRKFYEIDHGTFVKAAPWESLRTLKIRNFMEDLLLGFERDQ